MSLTKDDKNIVTLYALLIASTLMNFIPSITVQTFGGLLFFVTFIATYFVRNRQEEGSSHFLHCAHIITTVWIFSLLFTIGIIISVGTADHSSIITLINNINTGIVPTELEMMNAIKQFGLDNLILFLIIFLPMVV
ncbi:MAG: hypothetical protein AAF244_00400, partial [Pseudomonadota bacterium]